MKPKGRNLKTGKDEDTNMKQKPTAEVTIRRAQPGDGRLILSLVKELASYERLSHEVVATEEVLENALFGPAAVAEAVIACYGGSPVGFAVYFHNLSTFLGRPGIYLEDLYVRPDFRGKGIGRSLLSHLAQLTRERDCGRLEWAVLNWNESAIQFYRNLGAVPLKEWTVFRLTGQELEDLAAGE